MLRTPPRPPFFPYTTLFRSDPNLYYRAPSTIGGKTVFMPVGTTFEGRIDQTISSSHSHPGQSFNIVVDAAFEGRAHRDRKSTRLNSSHEWSSYAVFCLQKKKHTGRPLTRASQTYFLIAIRSMLRYWTLQGIEVLAPDRIELGKAASRSMKFLDTDQLRRLLAAPEVNDPRGLRDRALLETFFSTGLRLAELARLDRDDINLKTREFGVIGKGRKPRVVFLSDAACLWLGRYLESRSDRWKPLFIRMKGRLDTTPGGPGMRMSVRSIERVVQKYVKLAGLAVKATPHTLRHSFATDLLSNGADLRAVQELLGHANLNTTQIYTHVTNPQLRAVHRKFHSGNRE